MLGPIQITFARTPPEIARCLPVMQALRPHLADEADFVSRVVRQQAEGYELILLEEGGQVKAAAGFRRMENLHLGRYLYVDDLVTRAEDRSQGYGAMLFDWLVNHAKVAGCVALTLDSGVQRHGAHRFYLNRRMDITSHHFVLTLR